MIDDHEGERVDPYDLSTERLLEIRQECIKTIVLEGGDLAGRNWYFNDLEQIDEALGDRLPELCLGPAWYEHPLMPLWRDVVMHIRDAAVRRSNAMWRPLRSQMERKELTWAEVKPQLAAFAAQEPEWQDFLLT